MITLLVLLPIYGTIYIYGDIPPAPAEPEIQCATETVACEPPPKAVRLAKE